LKETINECRTLAPVRRSVIRLDSQQSQIVALSIFLATDYRIYKFRTTFQNV